MNKIKFLSIIFLVSFGLAGCYTIISHPIVKKDDSYHQIKFYHDCLSCHSKSELVEYGQVYLNSPDQVVIIEPSPVWITPSYVPPWWWDIRTQITQENNFRPNDKTKLRDLEGGRTSAPSDFSIPSRNSGSSSSSSGSSSSSVKSSTNSSNEQNSRERNSDTPKSRNNSGERKK
jgi:hypothetical protein